MSTDTRYNGWTNYATWRVNLEYFDGCDTDGATYTADTCRESVEEFVDNGVESPTLRGWLGAFLSDVNWQEIADAVNEANGTEDDEPEDPDT